MRLPILMIVSAGLLIGADAPKDDAGKKELKKIEGTWSMVSGELKGEKIPEQVAKKALGGRLGSAVRRRAAGQHDPGAGSPRRAGS